MKRVIAMVVLLGTASCAAHQRPQARENVQSVVLAAAVITSVMLISLAVPCDNCNIDDATRLAH